MFVPDESPSAPRVLAGVVAVCSLFACNREPQPPETNKTNTVAALSGAGGAAQVVAQGTGGSGPPKSTMPSVPIHNKNALSLDNIGAFTAKSGQYVTVAYAKKLFDEQNQFDEAKHRFKASKANNFHVCASLASTGKDFDLSLFVNGTQESAFARALRGGAQGCRTVKLKPSDTVEVRLQQASGEPMEFVPNEFWDWMNIQAVQGSVSLDGVEAFDAEPGKFTLVPYTSKRYDVDTQFDAKTHRFTPKEGGDYRVCAALSAPSQEFELDVFVDGQRTNGLGFSKHSFVSGCRTVRINKGQYIEVWTYPATGGPLKFEPKKYWNWLTVDKVAPENAPLGFYADSATSFGAPTNTFTKIPYYRKVFDGRNQFDPQVNRFVAAESNDYRVCASLTSLAQDFDLDIAVNGVREKGLATSSNGFARGCRTVRLANVGDTVEVRVHQTALPTLAFTENTYWDWITIEPLDRLK